MKHAALKTPLLTPRAEPVASKFPRAPVMFVCKRRQTTTQRVCACVCTRVPWVANRVAESPLTTREQASRVSYVLCVDVHVGVGVYVDVTG